MVGKGAAILFCVMLAVSFSHAAEVGRIDKLDVDLQLADAPKIEFKRGASFSPRVDPVNRWLLVKVEFTVKKSLAAPTMEAGKRGRVFFGGSLDDVELQVRVLMDTHFKRDKNVVYCLYTGRTEFYTIRCDGKKHLAVMFVPAKLIDRYSFMTDGQTRRMSKKDFKAEAVISRSGRVLARGYCNISGVKAFANASAQVPENLRIVGGVFPRSRTPWALIDFDGFDLEKEPFTPERD